MKTKKTSWQQAIPFALLIGVAVFVLLLIDQGKKWNNIPDWFKQYWPYILGAILLIIILAALKPKWRGTGVGKVDLGWIPAAVFGIGFVFLLHEMIQRESKKQPKDTPNTTPTVLCCPTQPSSVAYTPIVPGKKTTFEKGVTYGYDRQVYKYDWELADSGTHVIDYQMKDIPSQKWRLVYKNKRYVCEGTPSGYPGVRLVTFDTVTIGTLKELK